MNEYLSDNTYEIIIKDNEVCIINYDEIINFSTTCIKVRYKNKLFTIDGRMLIISKMMDQEVLINGEISNINIKNYS